MIYVGSIEAEVGFGERKAVGTGGVAVSVAFELTILFLALLTVQELGKQIDPEVLPSGNEVFRLRTGILGKESLRVLLAQRSSLSVHAFDLRIELVVPHLLHYNEYP